MQRLSVVAIALSLASLVACSSAPKPSAPPVQADQATQGQSQAADADQQAARPRRKYMNTGSRLPSESADPSVGGPPAGGLNNSTSNTTGSGGH